MTNEQAKLLTAILDSMVAFGDLEAYVPFNSHEFFSENYKALAEIYVALNREFLKV